MYKILDGRIPGSITSEIKTEISEAIRKQGIQYDRYFDSQLKDFVAKRPRLIEYILDQEFVRNFVHSKLQDPVVQHAFPLVKASGAPPTMPHQDWPFWLFDQSSSMFSLWVALEDVNRMSGCMRFCSKSYGELEHVRYEGKYKTLVLEKFEQYERDLCDQEASVGDVIYFDRCQIHAAHGNSSPNHRIAMKIAFGEKAGLSNYYYEYDKASVGSFYMSNIKKEWGKVKKKFARQFSRH